MLKYLTKKFVRFNSYNICRNLNNDYIVKEIILKFDNKKKFFYEEDIVTAVSSNDNKTYYLNVNTNTICKTCKGFGWITDNNLKGIKNDLSNQIKFKLCPTCQ